VNKGSGAPTADSDQLERAEQTEQAEQDDQRLLEKYSRFFRNGDCV
jgi:hypothetical protein